MVRQLVHANSKQKTIRPGDEQVENEQKWNSPLLFFNSSAAPNPADSTMIHCFNLASFTCAGSMYYMQILSRAFETGNDRVLMPENENEMERDEDQGDAEMGIGPGL